MQTFYQNNYSYETSFCLGDIYLKKWILNSIKGGCRLSYDDIYSLEFIKELEKDQEKIVLDSARVEDLVREYIDEHVGNQKRDRIAEIVIGLPCSGKTTYLNDKGYVICDSDLVKELMPEYENGIGNERCHDASKAVFDELLKELSYYGYNLGIPIVGKSITSFNKIYEMLTRNNYLIKIKYKKISKEESLNRALARFLEDGRFVSINYINEKIDDKKIDEVYETVINYPCVVEHSIDLYNSYETVQTYIVDAKCGHVGINHYVIKPFVVMATSGEEAAQIARYRPRVKHDHKDAIIEVKKVSVIEGERINRQNDEDKYFKCTCKRQQRDIYLELFEEEREEKKYERSGKNKKSKKYKTLEKEALQNINFHKRNINIQYE